MESSVLKIADKTELNQISLTGTRAIILIGLLIVAPRSLEEIRKTFINLKIMEESHSNDIIRIDINTIKAMGCEISRSSPKTNFKYVLTKHPFSFKIQEDELNVLKKIYNKFKEKADLQTLIDYDELFKKIATHIYDNETKEKLLGLSILKHYNLNLLKELIEDCKENTRLEILYQKPTSPKEYKKEIIASELVFQNDKIYLHGFDIKKNASTVLSLSRIKGILARYFNKDSIKTEKTTIKFIYKDLRTQDLDSNEIIIENLEDGYIIEGSYYNDFYATQRILSFGKKCVVLEPESFKNNIIEKIKEMRKNYGS